MNDRLPKSVFEFLALHVDSVELLDVLALLQADTGRQWSAVELDAVIRSNTQSIQSRLDALHRLGFTERFEANPVLFKYRPASEELGRMGKDLIIAYQIRRVEVIQLIYAKPVREMVSFSSAFNFRKGEKKDG